MEEKVISRHYQKRLSQFMSKVKKQRGTGCWLWQGGVTKQGYGFTSLKNDSMPAHRAAYIMLVGEIPEGCHLHHTCERKHCVNPKHLQAVTPREHVFLTPNNFANMNHQKDECENGHAFAGDNLYVYPDGRRSCRACKAAWARANRLPKAPKTHCRRGHEYTEDNVRWFDGRRYCKKCHAENTLRYYHERKSANTNRPDVASSTGPPV